MLHPCIVPLILISRVPKKHDTSCISYTRPENQLRSLSHRINNNGRPKRFLSPSFGPHYVTCIKIFWPKQPISPLPTILLQTHQTNSFHLQKPSLLVFFNHQPTMPQGQCPTTRQTGTLAPLITLAQCRVLTSLGTCFLLVFSLLLISANLGCPEAELLLLAFKLIIIITITQAATTLALFPPIINNRVVEPRRQNLNSPPRSPNQRWPLNLALLLRLNDDVVFSVRFHSVARHLRAPRCREPFIRHAGA
ncbi:hypothetical protein V8G54_008664 [Vigna mungo]|uniref:Uncharacterized protein n=1 Tax=Vigna mungo TaxID=3915 RepID=A0AAQ3P604_VIGMU